MGLIDLPIPIGNGAVYQLPLEFVIPLVITTILAAWYWRKARLAKRITKWIIKVKRSGAGTVHPPNRDMDTMVQYTDEAGAVVNAFKPNYIYTVPPGENNGHNGGDPLVKAEDQAGQKVLSDAEAKGIDRVGSVTWIQPIGWNELIAVHPEGLAELFDWRKMWDNPDPAATREMGGARLGQEAADTVASLKERVKLSFRENIWLFAIFGGMFLSIGIIIGLKLGGKF